MTSGPVVVQVLEGENAIAKNRELMGATDPKKAAPGTIRADFAQSIEANAVHGSDAAETARSEIAFFFAGAELVRATALEDVVSDAQSNAQLLGLTPPQTRRVLETLGEKPFRARQLMRWMYQRHVLGIRRDDRSARGAARAARRASRDDRVPRR